MRAVVLVAGRDARWRREGVARLRAAGATVRVASGAAEWRKALADGAVTQLMVDEDSAGGSSGSVGWPDHLPVVRRLPGESGSQTASRLLGGTADQGTCNT